MCGATVTAVTHTEPPPALDAPAAGEPRCPACLSLHRPGQTYCLECGARLAEEPGLPPPASARGASLTSGRRLALALIILALIAIGTFIAWAFTRDDERPRRPPGRRPAALHPAARRHDGPDRADHDADRLDVPAADGHRGDRPHRAPARRSRRSARTCRPPTRREPPATTEEPPLDEEPIDEWPAGLDAWATILISKEVDDFDNAYMEDLRSDAQAAGLTDLGILYSSDWSTLNPGFRVLYQGPFDTRDEANRAAVAAQGNGYEFAYPRHVAP